MNRVSAAAIQPEQIPARVLIEYLRSDGTFDLFERGDGPIAAAPRTTERGATAPRTTERVAAARSAADGPAEDSPFFRPIILAETQIVWGFAYEALLAAAPSRDLPVMRLPDSTGLLTRLLVALNAEGRRGAYRWGEIDRIVSLAERAGSGDADAATEEHDAFQAILQAINAERDVLPVLRRYRRLDETVRGALDDGAFDIRTAEVIPRSLVSRLPLILEELAALSFSERRQAVRIIAELVARGDLDDESVVELLRESPTEEIVSRLHRRRYPTIAALEEGIDRFRSSYARGRGIDVAFPKNYEGDFLSFSFRIRSAKELRRRIEALHRMEDHVDDVLGLLR